MTDLLNLPEFNIIKDESQGDNRRIWVETVSQPDGCPECGVIPPFSKYGKKEQLFMDIPVRGQRIGIIVKRQRYKCKHCNTVFFEPLDSMDKQRQLTIRLRDYIETESIMRSYTEVADSVGLDEKTVRNIFSEYVERLEQTVPRVFPTWLGIDEIHIIGKPRGVLTDIQRRLLYDFTTDRTKAVLDPYFESIDMFDRLGVEYVTMDMWKPYKDAVYKFFPNALVIVDKYHVVKELNIIMDKMRIGYKDGLSKQELKQLKRDRYILRSRRFNLKFSDEIILQTWESQYPELYEAYECKERFFVIYDSASNSTDAKYLFDEWKKSIPEYMRKYVGGLLTSMNNWEQEILNYFDCGLTNAFTEGLNNMIRTMNKNGRGYSFDVLRAKLLLAYGQKTPDKENFKLALKQQRHREQEHQKFMQGVENLKRAIEESKKK